MFPWPNPSRWKMSLLLLLMIWAQGKAEQRWGILSAFPKPMPVRYNAAVFPRFFTTQKALGLPLLPLDRQVAPLGENRSFQEEGSMCFMLARSEESKGSCMILKKQGLAWLEGETKFTNTSTVEKEDCIQANASACYKVLNSSFTERAVWFNGTFLVPGNVSRTPLPPPQPRFAPHCWGSYENEVWPWSDCQSAIDTWADSNKRFTFSPDMRGPPDTSNPWTQGFFLQDRRMKPYDKWMLCGINGSCTDLTTFSLLQGGVAGLSTFSGAFSLVKTMKEPPTKDWGASWNVGNLTGGITEAKEHFSYTTYLPAPVCVYPPFLFVLSNFSFKACSNNTCFLSQCWDAERFTKALVARVPRWVPVPVEAPSTMTLFRLKRDFGITAAVIVAISAAATAATVAGIAMSTTVQTAATLNNLSAKVAQALDSQTALDSHIKGGLMVVNQRIDLVQEQLDMLWQLAQLGCEWKFSALCITSVPYENYTRAANLSRSLSLHLAGNWSEEFDVLLGGLRRAVIAINSTRVDLSLANGMTSWITSAVSLFKEWVGVGMFLACCLGGCALCLWLVCRLRAQTKRDKVIISQALAALECGSSPQIWLSALKSN